MLEIIYSYHDTQIPKNLPVPTAEWAYSLVEQAHALGIPAFMKEDLVPIVGEANMVQEFPEAFNQVLEAQRKWRK